MKTIDILKSAALPLKKSSRTIGFTKENWHEITTFLDSKELKYEKFKSPIREIKDYNYVDKNTNPLVDLRKDYSEKILFNIKLLEISSFYPTVIQHLLQSEILKTDGYNNFKSTFLCIFENLHNLSLDKDIYYIYKSWVNYTFGILNSDKNSIKTNIDIRPYIYDVFQKIHTKLAWVYLDTDMIFYYDNDGGKEVYEIFNKLKFNYTTEKIPYVYIKSKKKYIYINNVGEIVSRGIKKVDGEDFIISELKSRNREKIIDSI